MGTWACARALIGAGDWYESLWERRSRIENKPALILWGMKDTAFREKELTRLESVFPNHRTERLERTGHFVQEEQPELCCDRIRTFLEQQG